jgi:hypothetical protein
MRIVAIVMAALVISASTARAQPTDERTQSEHRLWKVLIGTGALVAGTAVAAKSSKSTKVTGALGMSETSEFSKSQLVTGLVVAGTGGFLLWDGLRDRDPSRPSTRVAVGVGPKASGIAIVRRW